MLLYASLEKSNYFKPHIVSMVMPHKPYYMYVTITTVLSILHGPCHMTLCNHIEGSPVTFLTKNDIAQFYSCRKIACFYGRFPFTDLIL